jgi:putative oxidoreductase
MNRLEASYFLQEQVMSLDQRFAWAALLARVSLGVVLLAHGLLKVLVFTLPGTAGFFESVGLPGWAAYLVTPFEIVGGLALIAGFRSSILALASLPILLGAWWVHAGNGWLFTAKNGGWEFPAVLVMLAIVVALLGDGLYSVGQRLSQRSSS